jgi:hypothetical protein
MGNLVAVWAADRDLDYSRGRPTAGLLSFHYFNRRLHLKSLSPQRRLALIAIWSLVLAMSGVCVAAGWRLRLWTFDTFDALRWDSDIRRRFMWGLESTGPEGFLNQYDKMAIEQPDWTTFLDYSPLRLLVVRQWALYLRRHFPECASVPPARAYDRVLPPELRYSGSPEARRKAMEFHLPLLRFDAFLDLLGAVCCFALTRLWVRRAQRSPPRHWLREHFRGTPQGLIAAGLFWFNPNTLLNGYGWPTWDTWVAPFFLLAALLASVDLWLASGMVLAMGMMFKGQQLTIAVVFPLWAIVARGVPSAMRWIVGFVLATGLLVSPWMLSYLPGEVLERVRAVQASMPIEAWPDNLMAAPRTFDWAAALWIASTAIAAGVAFRFRRSRIQMAIGAGTCFLLAAWPALHHLPNAARLAPLAMGAVVAASLLWLPLRSWPVVISGIVGGGLLLCMALFHGSSAWWTCGFHFPQVQAPFLIYGPASNMPAVFELRFGWPREIDQPAFTLPAVATFAGGWLARCGLWPGAAVTVSSGRMFDSIFAVLLIFSGIGIGLQARRRDARVLVALVTPWVLFFLFPVRLHERYLLFAAATASICVGHSVGMALLGLVLTVASSVMTLDQMWSNVGRWGQDLCGQFPWLFSPQSGFTIRHYVENTHPDIAWGILVAGMVFFYLSITLRKRED